MHENVLFKTHVNKTKVSRIFKGENYEEWFFFIILLSVLFTIRNTLIFY